MSHKILQETHDNICSLSLSLSLSLEQFNDQLEFVWYSAILWCLLQVRGPLSFLIPYPWEICKNSFYCTLLLYKIQTFLLQHLIHVCLVIVGLYATDLSNTESCVMAHNKLSYA